MARGPNRSTASSRIQRPEIPLHGRRVVGDDEVEQTVGPGGEVGEVGPRAGGRIGRVLHAVSVTRNACEPHLESTVPQILNREAGAGVCVRRDLCGR